MHSLCLVQHLSVTRLRTRQAQALRFLRHVVAHAYAAGDAQVAGGVAVQRRWGLVMRSMIGRLRQ